jgi:alpha-N-arabinofuranosidase
MRPEFYADLYRQYNTFVKNYDRTKPIYRIAAGANSDEYRWTEVLMDVAGRRMDGLSLHYYTLPTGDWGTKGPATGFAEDQWFWTLKRTLRMDELIAKHDAVMDEAEARWKAAPGQGPGGDRKVGLVVDEWGTWYDVEKGTEPGFLYQQNSLRDALVAALNFHVFQRHADRVTMANIAQTVNVLQAMILTSKEKMLRTPTYWVFEMFKVHQGGTFLPVELQSPDYVFGQEKIPMVSASATRAADGSAIHLSLANTSPAQAVKLSVKLAGFTPRSVAGRILTATAMNAHNTFEAKDVVQPAAFGGATVKGDTLEVELPAKAVVVLALK